MGNVEIPKWLEGLPFAPEFRPTDTEFADPISYISKIEKEAGAYGICKIIPPLPKPSKRYVFANLNKSLAKCPDLGDDVELSNACSTSRTGSGDCTRDGEFRGVFTTRHQELGQSVKKIKGVVKENPQLGGQKQVWQSGEVYTLEQFESKSRAFARSLLGMIKEVNPLVIEALFWKAASEKPIYIEYANDVPGSAFGEPEGQFRSFRRHRRKRASYKSYRRRGENSDGKKTENDGTVDSQKGEDKKVVEVNDASVGNEPSASSETTPGSSTTSVSMSDETLRPLKRKSVNGGIDVEGTAGWKLSNCPWNLQVIARSPGSLTRFMPDDIPGVTSPMIYLGMLFSWFAWHVEDHELHSMNFLHIGSPKTWYSVPGDYAFAFEEVIRTEAYGGSIDRLAALTLLGEKTTLLSPQVVVSSGIPCCRLVQNPGEFVVTFPRAYHVGFSHGFNCGEAANFGTPQWLKVAKEAAIRRAAMNYLPMLSHQQLLYLLTMSFVLRVPRSLLPGARSSRLRDRQKEDREFSVKKAFIEDMLSENSILSVLLGKDTSYHVKIWNPDLLPCASKESQLSSVASTNVALTESGSHIHSEDCSNTSGKENDLFKEMRLYMETLNDFYEVDDDLSCDFQVDSGTLACVACGILGFPFMTVIQPSQRALMELLPSYNDQERTGHAGSRYDHVSSDPNGTANHAVSDKLHSLPNITVPLKDLPLPPGWNTSCKFLRPRIFCLEHALQIEELLQSKGGANMLIICHSDYQKMKAHAAAISEEIDIPFHYNEISLENACQEDLDLIDCAIDDEGHDECGEDWTSFLGINLQYCVKVRKNSPSKKVKHALELGGLFCEKNPSSAFSDIRWQNRRSRSRIRLNPPAHCKPCDIVGTSKDVIVKREETLIQYTRRKYKVKRDCSTYSGQELPGTHLEEVSVANREDLDKRTDDANERMSCNISITGRSSELAGVPERLNEVELLGASGHASLISPTLEGSPLSATVADKGNLMDSQLCKESNTGGSGSIEAARGNVLICYSLCDTAVDDGFGVQRENLIVENVNIMDKSCNSVSEGQHQVITDKDVSTYDASRRANPATLLFPHSPMGQLEGIVAEKSCGNGVSDLISLGTEVKENLNMANKSQGNQHSLTNGTNSNQPSASLEVNYELQPENCAPRDEVQEEVGSTSGIMLSNTNQPAVGSVDVSSEIQLEPSAELNLCSGGSSENNDIQHAIMTNEGNKDISCSVSQMVSDHPTPSSMEEDSDPLEETSAQEDLRSGLTINSEVTLEIPPMQRENDVEELNSGVRRQQHSISVSEEECFEVPEKDCAAKDSSIVVNLRMDVEQENNSSNAADDDEVQNIHQTASSNNKEPVRNHFSQTDQAAPASAHKYSVVEEESCNGENLVKSNGACSSPEPKSMKATIVYSRSIAGKSRKRKNEVEQGVEHLDAFIRSPCERLRSRAKKNDTARSAVDASNSADDKLVTKRARKPSNDSLPRPNKKKQILKRPHKCDLEGCHMGFETKEELRLHKRNRCTYEGCNQKFSSHRYALVHQRVHEDNRPLKCPWKGCSMSFKWAWARTEHIRVHTGEKPYQCKVEGCGLSFRFVSDYSRHRRKTGHYVDTSS
ncbi:hypothetical protein Tsubulata_035229 [Turnera subulata]|uniref:Lysine-specific demethylase ELF6 n=1 Tax=Turnera subulata TaxID=218843 RepID=A0A9Q0JED3_9ROSI|nr:hypothetical protein Tsubulata_035229 [Turnera subulata]